MDARTGLYYPNSFDSATPILSSNDKGESPKKRSLTCSTVRKGFYIYTGLSLFRELPEGVSGAYRLLSNMISLQANVSDKTKKLNNKIAGWKLKN
jgi:hypothetical protein